MVNGTFGNGKQFLQSDWVHDASGNYHSITKNDNKNRFDTRIRDILKGVRIPRKEEDLEFEMLVGIELAKNPVYEIGNQLDGYDHFEFKAQELMFNEKHPEGSAGSNFISKMNEYDRYIPILNFVVNQTSESWTVPIHSSALVNLDGCPPELQPLFESKYNRDQVKHVLFDPFAMSDQTISSFKTELGFYCRMIKASRNHDKIKDIILADPIAKEVPELAFYALEAILNLQLVKKLTNTETKKRGQSICV